MSFKKILLLISLLNFFVLIATAPAHAVQPRGSVVIDEIVVKDMNIADALNLLSRKSGMNIITSKSVQGKVTVFLKRVEAKEALRTIVEMNDLAFAEEGGIFRVMTSAEYLEHYGQPFGQPLSATRVIRLNFVPVRDVVILLAEMKSPEGKIIPNEEAKKHRHHRPGR